MNDPGARLISAALEAGVPVTVLPGPSAVETALVASGLVGERYQFLGYLPRGDEGARRALVRARRLAPSCRRVRVATKRLPATLRSLAAALPDRPVAVCRELTKRFEEVVRGSAAEVAERFPEPPKGELTLVVGAAEQEGGAADASAALAAVVELVAAGVPRRQAADVVARLARISRNTLYAESLKSR